MKKMMMVLLVLCSMVVWGQLDQGTLLERKDQASAERERQRNALLQIQEELRRQCGEKATVARAERNVMSTEEREFLNENPSGTNCFNRTFEQQQEYEKSFDLKSFLGFEFGKPCVHYDKDLRRGPVKMGKPFRMFDTVSFKTTSMSNLYAVTVYWRDDNVTTNVFVSEMEKVKSILEKRYEIPLHINRHSNRNGRYYSSNAGNVSIRLGGYGDFGGIGGPENGIIRSMRLSVTNNKVKELDDRKYEVELAKKSQKINIADSAGAELLDASQPNLEPLENEKLSGAMPAIAPAGVPGGAMGRLRARRLQMQAQAAAEREQRKAAEEYWQGWPTRCGISNHVAAVSEVEGQYQVTLLCERNKGRWRAGENRACIRFCANGEYERYDDKGILEMISEDASDFVELQVLKKKEEEFLKVERTAWAAKRGITYEDAMGRSNEWMNVRH